MGRRKKRKVHLLKFKKSRFPRRAKIRAWIRKNGYSMLKYQKNPIKSKGDIFEVRQREKRRFKPGSLRTEKIKGEEGVNKVTGILR